MRACIHRGAVEVGGSCVELEADGRRLLLDIGRPLDATPGEPLSVPPVGGGADDGSGENLLGVVVSHAHLDHYGLIDRLPPTTPIYAGQATADILREAAFFSPAGVDLELAGVVRDRITQRIGPFSVTPLLADHSAYDAYSLLVEAGGRRLLYTGDLRAHGRKRSFERLLAQPPDVDVVLLEGTRIGRTPAGDTTTERDVEDRLVELARDTAGALLIFSAAQNIDRLVSAYRAARRTGRTLVVDLYTATVAQATGRSTIPQPGFPALRVYVPQRQRVLVKQSGEFERVRGLGAARIFKEEIAATPGSFAVLAQPSTLPELAKAGCLAGTAAVWAMWQGYLQQASGERLLERLADAGVALHRVHASGHASEEDLRRLAAALAPARVVPIHTSAPERYEELLERVDPQPDGQWWEV
jgi:ribonuclease J